MQLCAAQYLPVRDPTHPTRPNGAPSGARALIYKFMTAACDAALKERGHQHAPPLPHPTPLQPDLARSARCLPPRVLPTRVAACAHLKASISCAACSLG